MTIAVMKTKAETTLAEHFETVLGRLPGGGTARKMRQDAFAAFVAQGLPHRRVEEWKYTDLRAMLKEAFQPKSGGNFGSQAIAETLDGAQTGMLVGVDAHTIIFVDGIQVTNSVASPAAKFEALRLADALETMPDWVAREIARSARTTNATLALNTAFMSDGAAIRVAEGVTLDQPIHLIFQTSGTENKLQICAWESNISLYSVSR